MSDQSPDLQLDTNDVISELVQIPEARTYWELAQERAARKLVQRRMADQENELQELRALTGRAADSTAAEPEAAGG